MDLVHRIEDLPKDGKDKPLQEVVIASCGELPPHAKEEGEKEKMEGAGSDAN